MSMYPTILLPRMHNYLQYIQYLDMKEFRHLVAGIIAHCSTHHTVLVSYANRPNWHSRNKSPYQKPRINISTVQVITNYNTSPHNLYFVTIKRLHYITKDTMEDSKSKHNTQRENVQSKKSLNSKRLAIIVPVTKRRYASQSYQLSLSLSLS